MAYVDPRLSSEPVPAVSVEQMERGNVARLAQVKGSDLAFLDQRLPGQRREIINMIGMGVTENLGDPALAPKIKAPAHGFAVGYVRNTPKGNGAALHRHPTEEVFIAAKGPWEVFWLEGDAERVIRLEPGDIVNVPIGVYRGFRNASDDLDAVLIAVVGGPDPGKVDWHPSVIEAARKTGLSVDDDGRLIVDEAAEQARPPSAHPEKMAVELGTLMGFPLVGGGESAAFNHALKEVRAAEVKIKYYLRRHRDMTSHRTDRRIALRLPPYHAQELE